MILVRLCKFALIGAAALFFSLVAFGNITDYDSNWQFVQHVLSMDTTFPNSAIHWRAVTSPTLQQAGYVAIIACEVLVSLLLWVGAALLLARIAAPDFDGAKPVAIAGLTLGLLLYAVGFVAIGGEWFAMWQSQIWNGQQKAFDFIGMLGVILLVTLMPDSTPKSG
jgi:predicted small integral membrane protein